MNGFWDLPWIVRVAIEIWATGMCAGVACGIILALIFIIYFAIKTIKGQRVL